MQKLVSKPENTFLRFIWCLCLPRIGVTRVLCVPCPSKSAKQLASLNIFRQLPNEMLFLQKVILHIKLCLSLCN